MPDNHCSAWKAYAFAGPLPTTKLDFDDEPISNIRQDMKYRITKKADLERKPGLEQVASQLTLFTAFLRLGLTAFGGPAMVAYIREMAVTRRRWLERESFQDGVVLVQSLPGATAMQMAAYVGLQTRGTIGALAAYTGFALPSFIMMLALSMAYAHGRDLPSFIALFTGLQVLVVAIVAQATWSFGRELIRGLRVFLLAAAAAILLWRGISPFLVIIGAAFIGMLVFRQKPPMAGITANQRTGGVSLKLHLLKFAALLILLGAVMALLLALDAELFGFAALMLRIDIFAFGGGFASLPLMLHEVVNVHGWLDSNTFMEGIALGQVTPGPIVITTAFIGYLVYGLAGAVVGTIAIFTPSFLLVVGFAPLFGRLKSSPWFLRATTGILASFVGLLLFVTVKFALAVPWDAIRVLLGLAALAALLRKVDILYVVLAGAAVSLLLFR
jgi:chromate transporter